MANTTEKPRNMKRLVARVFCLVLWLILMTTVIDFLHEPPPIVVFFVTLGMLAGTTWMLNKIFPLKILVAVSAGVVLIFSFPLYIILRTFFPLDSWSYLGTLSLSGVTWLSLWLLVYTLIPEVQ